MVLSKQQKMQTVEALSKRIIGKNVIAVVSLQNLPSKHYNKIKGKMREDAEIVVTRASLLRKALEKGNSKAFAELAKYLQKKGSVALLLSNTDPFKLSKKLRQNKSKAPAKAGLIAKDDIVVPAGETNLAPGPVLTELKQAKINAKIQGTKIVIQSDATVAKKGEAVSQAAAGILSKLGIEPFEIGLSMTVAYADGMIYHAEILDVDDSVYMEQLKGAHAGAVNLAVFAEIYNAYSTPLILAGAQAKALALQKVAEEKMPKEQAAA